jgi:predicted DsbA family dithiol-disulfide isomerase
MPNEIAVDVWSDIACPWCYVGKRRLEAALKTFPDADKVKLTWRAFELDPSAPRVRDDGLTHAERIAAKYGMSPKDAEERMKHLTDVAAKDGLDMRFDIAQSGNTLDGHRLVHFATAKGGAAKGDEAKERLFHAYFTEGVPVGEIDALVKIGGELGLGEEETRAMLAGDAYVLEVRADEEEAARLGIRGVPFFVVGEKYGVSGAQTAEVLRQVLDKVSAEQKDTAKIETHANGEVGEACGVDGCA